MKTKTTEMNEIDVEAHAELILTSRQNSPLRSADRTIEGLREALEALRGNPGKFCMITAHDDTNNELIGQIYIWLEWSEMAVVTPWQPIVHPNRNQTEIAKALIEHAKSILESHSKSRLEIWMELTDAAAKELGSIYIPWYEECGFTLKAQEYYMDTKLSDLSEHGYSIPDDIEIVSMNEIENEEIVEIALDTFRNSDDKWFKTQTESEQKGTVESWFKRDETFDVDGSIVFKAAGRIIGYNVMRVEDETIEVGPIGVIPDSRRRGIGEALLLASIDRMRVKNLESVWLTVSTENDAAYELYKRLGFQNQYTILIYTWMPNVSI
ncbi:MAG: GNAT family N-acetyltransferase [Candidatus Thorarchaeota archaeon]